MRALFMASNLYPCARIWVTDEKRKRTYKVHQASDPQVPDYVSVGHAFPSPEEAASLTMAMLLARHKKLMDEAEVVEAQMLKTVEAMRAARKQIEDDAAQGLDQSQRMN